MSLACRFQEAYDHFEGWEKEYHDLLRKRKRVEIVLERAIKMRQAAEAALNQVVALIREVEVLTLYTLGQVTSFVRFLPRFHDHGNLRRVELRRAGPAARKLLMDANLTPGGQMFQLPPPLIQETPVHPAESPVV